MTNWQDKYKDLEVGQSAWYWHKAKTRWPKWEAIKISRYISMQDGYPVFVAYDICGNQITVSEDFPNGPKCITPDELCNMIVEYEKERVYLQAQLDTINKLTRSYED